MPTLADRFGDDLASGPAPSAARVGADLRAAREKFGWTLADMSAHLRIRIPYLEAIEDGRIGDLPGNAYAVGFVRAYAQSLGLDPDEIARRFRSEAAEVNRKTELAFPAPVPERGVPALAVVLVGAIIAVGGYAAWYRMSGDQHPSHEVVQQVPDRLVPLVTTKPDPVADAVPSATPAPTATATTTPTPTPSPTMPAAVATPATATPSVPPRPDGGRIAIHAKTNLYVEVKDNTGAMVFHHRFKPDETEDIPPAPPGKTLIMATEDAGGTELVVDGVTAPSLGPDKKFRRDLTLDPDAILAGKLAYSPPVTFPPRTPTHQNQ